MLRYKHDIGSGTRLCGSDVKCSQNTQKQKLFKDPLQIELGLVTLSSVRACREADRSIALTRDYPVKS